MESRLELTEDDVQELRALFASRGWQIIYDVICSWKENNIQALMTTESHAEMLRRQGSYRTLERLKGVKDEILSDKRAAEQEALAQIRS